jgi:hypothetical protein
MAVAAAVVAIAFPGCEAETDRDDVLNALVAFARQPSDETWASVPFADRVKLGLGDRLLKNTVRAGATRPGRLEARRRPLPWRCRSLLLARCARQPRRAARAPRRKLQTMRVAVPRAAAPGLAAAPAQHPASRAGELPSMVRRGRVRRRERRHSGGHARLLGAVSRVRRERRLLTRLCESRLSWDAPAEALDSALVPRRALRAKVGQKFAERILLREQERPRYRGLSSSGGRI